MKKSLTSGFWEGFNTLLSLFFSLSEDFLLKCESSHFVGQMHVVGMSCTIG